MGRLSRARYVQYHRNVGWPKGRETQGHGAAVVVGGKESLLRGEAAIRSLETTPKRRGGEIETITILDNLGSVEVRFLSPRCRGDAHSPQLRLTINAVKRE